MSSRSLGEQMVRTAGIFQGITALPVMIMQGETAFEELTYYNYLRIYRFITAACTGLMAAGILFTILVARHPRNTKSSIYYLEIVKSGLATALWLWLLLDSIFGPLSKYSPPPRSKKIIESVICFFVLPVLFYPTLVFSRYDKNHGEFVGDEETQPTEREPLLRGQ